MEGVFEDIIDERQLRMGPQHVWLHNMFRLGNGIVKRSCDSNECQRLPKEKASKSNDITHKILSGDSVIIITSPPISPSLKSSA